MAVWSKSFVKDLHFDRRMDAEYYQPKYIAYETAVKKAPNVVKLGTLGDFVIGPFGSAFDTKKYESHSEYRYIRGRDVKPFILLDDDNRYIPEEDYRRLARYQVRDDDIFISVVGTLGNAAICPTHNIKAVFSCKSTVFRQRKIDAYYLLSYLNTKYGFNLLIRRQRGAVQGGLNAPDLSMLLVPRFESSIEKDIGAIVKKSIKLRNSAKDAYIAAERMLAEALKLDDLKLERPLSYTAKFSDVLREGRTDAEYYHGKYEPMLAQIRKYSGGVVKLSELTKKIDANFNPIAVNGDVNYTEIGDVNISNGRYISNVVHGKDLPTNAKIRLEGGELLISTVRPTRGAITIIKDKLPLGVNLCSGAFYVCTVQDKKQREILWLYLREVKDLFEKYCGGSSYPTIDARYIQDFPVPRFDETLACEVRKLVLKSKREASKSDALLAEAKATVERLIEAAADRP